jgi:hypothetical protein
VSSGREISSRDEVVSKEEKEGQAANMKDIRSGQASSHFPVSIDASAEENAGDCGPVIKPWDTRRNRIQLGTLALGMRRLFAAKQIGPTTSGLKLVESRVLDLVA